MRIGRCHIVVLFAVISAEVVVLQAAAREETIAIKVVPVVVVSTEW